MDRRSTATIEALGHEPAVRCAGGEASVPIRVEIVDPARFGLLQEAWAALVERAACPNVCMHPAVAAAAAAAAAASGGRVHVLLAWAGAAETSADRVLVGVWVLAVRPFARFLPTPVLASPVDAQLMLGSPVLDRGRPVQALMAMLDALAASRDLPKILRAAEFPCEGPAIRALDQALAARGAPQKVLRRFFRPKLQPGSDPQGYLDRVLSKERRRKLRRYRRRLAELGALELTLHHEPQDVRRAFDEFLVLEASGWKGQAGTALAQRDEATVAFLRAMVEGLAQDGSASVMVLRLDGRPAAAQVFLRSGGTAFAWKCAYDESLQDCGPGVLLMEDVTRVLLADPSLEFGDLSTNMDLREVSMQAEFWAERLAVADLLIDVRPGGSLAFQLLGLANAARDLCATAICRTRPRT